MRYLILIVLIVLTGCGSPGGGFTNNPYEFVLGRYQGHTVAVHSFTLYIERLQPGGFDGQLDCEGWVEVSYWQFPKTGRVYFKDDRVTPPGINPDRSLDGEWIAQSEAYGEKSFVAEHWFFDAIQISPHPKEPEAFLVSLVYFDGEVEQVLVIEATR